TGARTGGVLRGAASALPAAAGRALADDRPLLRGAGSRGGRGAAFVPRRAAAARGRARSPESQEQPPRRSGPARRAVGGVARPDAWPSRAAAARSAVAALRHQD